MKQCKRCGRKLPNDARICAYCGLKLTGQQTSAAKSATKKSAPKKASSSAGKTSKRSSYDSYRKKKMQQEAKKKRRRRRLRFLIFWLVVFTILAAVFGGMYANKNYKSVINPTDQENVEAGEKEASATQETEKTEDNEASAPTATPEPKQEPEATPKSTEKSETLSDKVENSGCTVYEDASYEFKCAYPADFSEGTLKNNNTRASYTDVNGGADVLINFEKVGKSETPKKLLNDYLEIIGVDPDVDNSGTNFYSVTFTRGGRVYHRKALIANEKYIYYDFMYDQGSDSRSRYEDYIDIMDMYLEQANKELIK